MVKFFKQNYANHQNLCPVTYRKIYNHSQIIFMMHFAEK